MKYIRAPARVLRNPCRSNYARWTRRLLEPILDSKKRFEVLDLTFGRGRMWGCLEHKVSIVAFDIEKWPWEVVPQEFYKYPAWKWRVFLDGTRGFDIVAVDPPWATRRGYEKYGRQEFQSLLGSPRLILEVAVQAARHYKAYLVVHWKTEYKPTGFREVNAFFTQVSIMGRLTRSYWGLLVEDSSPPKV